VVLYKVTIVILIFDQSVFHSLFYLLICSCALLCMLSFIVHAAIIPSSFGRIYTYAFVHMIAHLVMRRSLIHVSVRTIFILFVPINNLFLSPSLVVAAQRFTFHNSTDFMSVCSVSFQYCIDNYMG
jgi:hypothetical protein